jgi:outer membrane biosynthesis protein TonB
MRTGRFLAAGFGIGLLAAGSGAAFAQAAAPQQAPAAAQPSAPSPQSATPSSAPTETEPSNSASPAGTHAIAEKDPVITAGDFTVHTLGGEIKEDQLKQMLVGKTMYLRAGYQDNNLEFDEQGHLTGHSPKGSFTLSQVQINKVKLSKHKLELEGDRYALHFLGAAPYEDPTKATDRVKINPKKKAVHVSFDREQVETPKKKKEKGKGKHKENARNHSTQKADDASAKPDTATESASETSPVPPAASDRQSDDKKTSKTTSPVHASQLLLTALDSVFSRGIDDRMIAAMPDFWKVYYQAAEQKAEIKPVGSGVYAQNNVDQKAKLISAVDPPSNAFAQANGVAGIAMYHTIIGSDGKVEQVVAGRPIGFGLDESADQTIRKAVFQPAIKDGKPVPVALDLVVSFRIYSKRTSVSAPEQSTADKSDQPVLPGPYTLQAEEAEKQAAQKQAAQQNATQAAQPSPDPQQASQPAPDSQQSSQPAPSAQQPVPSGPAQQTPPASQAPQ